MREYGTRPMPSSLGAGNTSDSGSRVQSEYSDCTAVTGCTAWARRIVFTPVSDKPMWRILPSVTNSAAVGWGWVGLLPGLALVGLCTGPLLSLSSISLQYVLPESRRSEGFSVAFVVQSVGFVSGSFSIGVLDIGTAIGLGVVARSSPHCSYWAPGASGDHCAESWMSPVGQRGDAPTGLR
ncbi:hypothetical protein TL08_15965 [Actinoalloteichus hymeniacidonis]|uniref:Uncharacterized protein n=2 Tax=Actinoalloteichus hymeniacidonis TaxID=340345 RepID=A0AAC9HT42_9PSEU|nr:hypothetical protein TL08_15965 [Actinoalloteichus hymeniacidonis]